MNMSTDGESAGSFFIPHTSFFIKENYGKRH